MGDMAQALVIAGLLMLVAGVALAWLGTRRMRRAPLAQPGADQADVEQSIDAARWTYQFLEQVLGRVQDGVIVSDEQGRILEANEAAVRILGRKAEELGGNDLHALACPSVFDENDVLLPQGSTRLKTAADPALAVSFTSCPLVEADGHRRWVLVFRNLSNEHRSQKRIRYLARYDALTRVPNRMEFQHRLQQAIARARRSTTRAALLYLDVDGFKDVNDRLGHPIGDRARHADRPARWRRVRARDRGPAARRGSAGCCRRHRPDAAGSARAEIPYRRPRGGAHREHRRRAVPRQRRQRHRHDP